MTKARSIAAIALLAMSAMAPLLITPAGAQQLSDRVKQVGGKFMCMCGCSQVLTECNHVGCTTSAGMLKELNAALPRIYLFLGTAVVIFVIYRWRKQAGNTVEPASRAPGISPELLERARAQASRETQD